MNKCPPGQEFYLCNGAVADSVEALAEHVKELSSEQFSQHVNKEKNDFYNWVYGCIDKKLGKTIKNVKSQRAMVEKLAGHSWEQKHKNKHKN